MLCLNDFFLQQRRSIDAVGLTPGLMHLHTSGIQSLYSLLVYIWQQIPKIKSLVQWIRFLKMLQLSSIGGPHCTSKKTISFLHSNFGIKRQSAKNVIIYISERRVENSLCGRYDMGSSSWGCSLLLVQLHPVLLLDSSRSHWDPKCDENPSAIPDRWYQLLYAGTHFSHSSHTS